MSNSWGLNGFGAGLGCSPLGKSFSRFTSPCFLRFNFAWANSSSKDIFGPFFPLSPDFEGTVGTIGGCGGGGGGGGIPAPPSITSILELEGTGGGVEVGVDFYFSVVDLYFVLEYLERFGVVGEEELQKNPLQWKLLYYYYYHIWKVFLLQIFNILYTSK